MEQSRGGSSDCQDHLGARQLEQRTADSQVNRVAVRPSVGRVPSA